MPSKSSKSKSTRAKAVAPKKLKPLRKKAISELDPDKFLVEDGIRYPASSEKIPAGGDGLDFEIDPETALVSDAMTRQTLYCYADQSAIEVRDIMRLHGVKQLPVVDTTMRIIGIVYRDAIEEITAPKKK